LKNGTFIRDYLQETSRIAADFNLADIDRVIEILYEAWQNGSQVFICGNGGSASTATHFTCDLAKSTIIEGERRFITHCLNDNVPLVSALTNDNGFDNLYTEQLMGFMKPGDVLICISVHGGAGRDKAQLWSQNLLKAMKYVQEHGGKAVGFSGFDGGPMKDIADACVVVPADSTPQVESFHLALEHLVCSALKEKIRQPEAVYGA
jgi:D-sedoheptulose 7-phosphate isomerase